MPFPRSSALTSSPLTPREGSPPRRRRLVIVGAAGRDFHNFNVVFRDDPGADVVAFTAAQITGNAGRRYPASLAGPLYPTGIPIVPESELEALCRAHAVDEVVFAYSDVSHEHVPIAPPRSARNMSRISSPATPCSPAWIMST